MDCSVAVEKTAAVVEKSRSEREREATGDLFGRPSKRIDQRVWCGHNLGMSVKNAIEVHGEGTEVQRGALCRNYGSGRAMNVSCTTSTSGGKGFRIGMQFANDNLARAVLEPCDQCGMKDDGNLLYLYICTSP